MKFHINNKGTPAACTATVNKCPYGGTGSHYTKEDAHLVCKIQNELNHGLINSSRKNVKKAETKEELRYIEVRRNALIANGNEMKETAYVEKIISSIQIEDFSPNVIETHHFKVERENRNKIIEEIGKGKVIGDFECEIKVKDADVKQIHRIYDSGYVEIYKLNKKDKENETHNLVTAYIFKRNQIEGVFLNSGYVVSSEWLADVSNNNKKMKKELKNKLEENKQKVEVEKVEVEKIEIEKKIYASQEELTKTSEKNKFELTEEQQERKRNKNAKRRQRQRENAKKRKSEIFSKEQIENERSN